MIAENGVGEFSLAEASRRLGVTVSAPYRHFADREELIVAVGIRACEMFVATVAAEGAMTDDASAGPEGRLVAAARGYVRFAGEQRRLFEAIFGSGLKETTMDSRLDDAVRPVKDAFLSAAVAICDGDEADAQTLAIAVGVTAHGCATMIHLGALDSAETAVATVERSVRALILGRAALRADAPEPRRP